MLIERDPKRPMRLIVAAVIFVVVAAMVYKNSMLITTVDTVFQALFASSKTTGFVHGLMTMTAFLASPKMDIIWVLVIAFFLWGFKGKIPALWALFTLFGGDVLGVIIKHIIKRERPAQHLASDTGFSFPSGHVLGFFLVAAIISLVVVPLIKSGAIRVIIQLVLIFAVVLVAISRVYLQAHYPSDTIGAMLLAYTWLQFAEALYVGYAAQLRNLRLTHNSWY
ncbi:MAG: phosphatase PAP2 family protein [Limosilactobacillus gorillae]|jgi:membrane-associated phospholipid phosphatase|uniref:phosphatase PAP2 family protein n=1 Tax=Limosilactobacillus gorillae TaxID=1450649 RepID=UPI000A834500|nr:phosphatase PAP2 family protein [Limosilactobacillus gorillae]MDO4855140.1 phosphatase PAP2 family protein [Limosilactobacillus gorillae]